MSTNMVSAITQNIGVSVETFFQTQQSKPDFDLFVYSYRITIKNESEFSVQLLSRFWEIFDVIMEKRIVEGEGVVGEQPILMPGQSYQYVSYCQLKTDAGSMKGYYTFKRQVDDFRFDAVIPEFMLLPEYRRN
ncbi:MAG: Co2+/Mg2+ efflux protein ApaG [Bacteroidia bacterium]